jgi:hypothetical protein
MAQDTKERRYEIPLDGKLITGDDPAKIGPNFQSLKNLRYSNNHPKAIGGMTKINSSVMNATYLKARSGLHFRKDQPSESHLLVEAYNTGLTASRILQNTTAIPSSGNFSSTSLFTLSSNSNGGRWSYAPNGDVAYCNGSEVCIWGGTEMEIGGFINYLNETAAPGAGTTQDFTVDADTNILTTSALVGQTQSIVSLSTSDTLPSPLGATTYYIRRISDTQYTLHNLAIEAYYNANIINITDTGTGTHTMTPVSGATVSTQTIYDYTNQLRNTATDTPNIAIMNEDTDGKLYFYIGSSRPLSGFKLYVSVANSDASSMGVDYWDGTAWTSVSSLVDGTSSGSVSLASTGSVSFTSTVSVSKLKYIKGIYIYWYRVTVSAISSGTTLYYATVNAPFQAIKDIWSGDNFEIDSFKINRETGVYEATVQVRENKLDINDGGTYIELNDLKTSESVTCGFNERMTGVSFSFYTEASNESADSTMSVNYWNGTAWTSVGAIDDGTLFGTASFAQTGTVTWDAISPELEHVRNFENGPMLYYYQFTFATQLSASVSVYWVTGIPAQKDLTAYSFPLLSNNRLFLCGNTNYKKNSSLCSAVETSSVFNGKDSVEHFFGDESELTGGAWIYSQFGSSLFNVTLFFKKNETWALVGKDPEDWVQYRVSGIVGCTDPGTIRVVDLGVENTQGMNRNVAIWRAANSIVISDGRTPIDISNDIKDVFDKLSSTYIPAGGSTSFWDADNKEYHWLTTSRELVFSFVKQSWFEVDRTTGKTLKIGIEVQDTNGANYVYGFIDTGYAERLEYGTTMDGTAIPFTMQLGDMAIRGGNISLETTPKYTGFIATSKTAGTVAISHYGNGSTTANESWSKSLISSGNRLSITLEHKTQGRFIFHSWKFITSTSTETVGFEPLYLYVLYDVEGDHTRDRS